MKTKKAKTTSIDIGINSAQARGWLPALRTGYTL